MGTKVFFFFNLNFLINYLRVRLTVTTIPNTNLIWGCTLRLYCAYGAMLGLHTLYEATELTASEEET